MVSVFVSLSRRNYNWNSIACVHHHRAPVNLIISTHWEDGTAHVFMINAQAFNGRHPHFRHFPFNERNKKRFWWTDTTTIILKIRMGMRQKCSNVRKLTKLIPKTEDKLVLNYDGENASQIRSHLSKQRNKCVRKFASTIFGGFKFLTKLLTV